MGISKEDPRLKGVIKSLTAMPSNYGIGNIKLTREQFSKFVKKSML